MKFPTIGPDGNIDEITLDNWTSKDCENIGVFRHQIGYSVSGDRSLFVDVLVQVDFMIEKEPTERKKAIDEFIMAKAPWFFSYGKRYQYGKPI